VNWSVSKLQDKGGRLIGTVHDEIIFEGPATVADEIATILRDTMNEAGSMYLKEIPVNVEVKMR
jgi:DNA polymerase-1